MHLKEPPMLIKLGPRTLGVTMNLRLLWIAGWWLMLGLAGCQQLVQVEQLLGTSTPVPAAVPTAAPTIPPTPEPYSQAGFAAFATQATAARNADRQRLVNDYISRLPQYPLVDEAQAVLIWRGAAREVTLVGDMTSWQPALAQPLTRFADTDTWYIQIPLPPAARLDYLFVVDGQQVLDALNPITRLRPAGPRSELVMPGYAPPAELTADRTAAPAGTLTRHTLESAVLGQTRTFFVYQPAQPPATAAYPTLYVNDGSDYLTLVQAPSILDWLIAQGAIEPLVAVFVPPFDRTQEYDQNDAYAQFMAQELVPFVQATYATDPAPERTAVLGAGLGGLEAVHTAVTYPETFGLVAAHSADLARNDEVLTRRLRLQATLPLQFHLVVGTFETAVDGRDVLVANQRFASLLAEKGYPVTYVELPQGASWGLWEAQLGAAVRLFFAN